MHTKAPFRDTDTLAEISQEWIKPHSSLDTVAINVFEQMCGIRVHVFALDKLAWPLGELNPTHRDEDEVTSNFGDDAYLLFTAKFDEQQVSTSGTCH